MGVKKTQNSLTCTSSVEKTQMISNREISLDEPPVLYMVSGPYKMVGQAWVLQEDQIVGRDRNQSHILIQETGISRKHILIKCQEEQIKVQDLGSTNGSFLNEDKMEPHQIYDLKNNDLIKIGNVIFKFSEKGHVGGHHVLHVQNQIHQDNLCQIKNRAFMELKAKDFFLRYKKRPYDFCFVIFDIDFFKKINDEYSHLAGDFILRSVAQSVQEWIRQTDTFCRIGGEEFGLLLPCSSESASRLVEKIRKSIESEVFHFGSHALKITISAGVSFFQESDSSWKDVYARADTLLYQAKKKGRNRVQF